MKFNTVSNKMTIMLTISEYHSSLSASTDDNEGEKIAFEDFLQAALLMTLCSLVHAGEDFMYCLLLMKHSSIV